MALPILLGTLFLIIILQKIFELFGNTTVNYSKSDSPANQLKSNNEIKDIAKFDSVKPNFSEYKGEESIELNPTDAAIVAKKILANRITPLDEKTNLVEEPWILSEFDKLWTQCTSNIEATPSFLNPTAFYSFPSYIDQVDFLLNRYQIPQKYVKVFMNSSIKGAGVTTYNNEQSFSIVINQDLVFSKEIVAAVIAHEIAHIYLHFKNIINLKLSNDILDEYRVDIATFVIGLGLIMLKGSGFTEKDYVGYYSNYGSSRVQYNVGYLSNKQLEYVHNLTMMKISEIK